MGYSDPHLCSLGAAACYLLFVLMCVVLMTSSHSEGHATTLLQTVRRTTSMAAPAPGFDSTHSTHMHTHAHTCTHASSWLNHVQTTLGWCFFLLLRRLSLRLLTCVDVLRSSPPAWCTTLLLGALPCCLVHYPAAWCTRDCIIPKASLVHGKAAILLLRCVPWPSVQLLQGSTLEWSAQGQFLHSTTLHVLRILQRPMLKTAYRHMVTVHYAHRAHPNLIRAVDVRYIARRQWRGGHRTGRTPRRAANTGRCWTMLTSHIPMLRNADVAHSNAPQC